jgi:hypothetical protein
MGVTVAYREMMASGVEATQITRLTIACLPAMGRLVSRLCTSIEASLHVQRLKTLPQAHPHFFILFAPHEDEIEARGSKSDVLIREEALFGFARSMALE